MSNVILCTRDDEKLEGPENEAGWSALTHYDPNDPESLQRAREALKKRFSLNYLPTLCNEPEPGFLEKLWRNWFGGKNERPTRTNVMARPAKQPA